LGVPIIAGRDFNDLDSLADEPVVIVSQTLAQRMFPNQDPINRHVYWTDPVLQFSSGTEREKSRLMGPHRIIGVSADITMDTLFLSLLSPYMTPWKRGPSLAVASSSTRARIHMGWSRRSRASFATCPPTSLSSMPPLSR